MLIFLIISYFIQNVSTLDFQYKNIVLGVVLAPETLPIGQIQSINDKLRDLIETTLNGTSPIFSSARDLANLQSGSSANDSVARTASITITEFDLGSDFEKVSDLSALFSLAGCAETHELNNRTATIFGSIFHVAFTEFGCQRLPQNSAITVPLTWFHWNGDLVQLFIDARNDRLFPSWRHAVVIYDYQSREGALDSLAQAFRSHMQFEDVTMSLFTVDSMSSRSSFSDQIENILAKYTGSRPIKFIVVSEFTKINLVLALAKRKKLLSIMKQWLFVAADAIEDEDRWDYIRDNIIADGVNIAFITANHNFSNNSSDTGRRQHIDNLFCHTESLMALLFQTIENLALQEQTLFRQVSEEEWDIIKPSRTDRVKSITDTMNDRLGSFVASICDQTRLTWNLEAGEFATKGKRVFEVGRWKPMTGLRMTDDLFPHVTGGFRARKILVASMHFPPWQFIVHSKEQNENKVTYSGLTFEVLAHLGKKLNFSYEVLEPQSGEAWGTVQADGRWNGMMRLIIENPKIVMGAAAFTVTPERARFVNFTEVLERESVAFIVNRPSELSRVLLFAEPFRYEVWLCLLAMMLVMGPVLYFAHRSSYYYKFHGKFDGNGLFKLKNCYWFIYGSLLQQGGIHLPEAGSGQLLLTFWWLFVIVCVISYSASLVAFLTYPKVENPVSTVDHLLRHRGVDSWGFTGAGVIEDYLKKSTDPKLHELYENAIIHPVFNESVLEAVKKKDHAYIDWKIALMTMMKDVFTQTGVCEYTLGEETIFEEKIALAVPRDSPYLPLFNQEIKKMQLTGLFKKWKAKYWPQHMEKCFSSVGFVPSDSRRTVKLGDMQGSFYLLLMGLFLSGVVLLGEVLNRMRINRRKISSVPIIGVVEKKKGK